MKLKGVNPLEQHLEKVVLAVVGAVFLVALALQFLGEPNAVKVGREEVAPGRAYEGVARKAQSLKARLEQTEPAELVTARERVSRINLNLTEEFTKRKDAPVSPPLPRQVALGPEMKLNVEGVELRGPNAPIAVLRIPAPTQVVAAATRNTIDPTETIAYPELQPLLPAEQPLDKASVSVEAQFNGAALKAAFLADPGDSKSRHIPGQWWRETTALMDVKLERQERGAGGEWGEAVAVKYAPGRFDMVEALKNVQNTIEMEDMVFQARGAAPQILRPRFYRTIAGPAWITPAEQAEALAAGGRPPEVDRHLARRRSAKEAEQRLERRIEEQGRQPSRQPQGPSGGGGGRGGRGAAPQQPTQRDPNRERNDAIKRLEDQLKQKRDEIARIDEQLRELGFDESGNAVRPAAPVESAEGEKPLLESDAIRLWAHDLTVEPGKTYRYRVQVAINNPAFARGTALVPEQQDMAKSPLLYSEPSEWSQPVRVMENTYYFITGASEADQFGSRHASVEMYEFFYGYYRKGTTTVEPGDVLMARLNLPPGERLPIYDLQKPAGEAGQPGAAPPPAPGPVAPPPPPGGKGPVPGPGRGDPRGTQPERPAAEQQPVLPENATPWSKQLFARADAILLDVARPPAGPDPQALLRVADGSIVARDPSEDRSSELYKRVAQSAKEGENQGMPVVGPGGPEEPQGPRRPGRDEQPPTPGKTGGGGGGTG